MTQLPADTISASAWRAYTGDTTEAEARETYRLREGTQPAIVGTDQWGKVLAGPVAKEQHA